MDGLVDVVNDYTPKLRTFFELFDAHVADLRSAEGLFPATTSARVRPWDGTTSAWVSCSLPSPRHQEDQGQAVKSVWSMSGERL